MRGAAAANEVERGTGSLWAPPSRGRRVVQPQRADEGRIWSSISPQLMVSAIDLNTNGFADRFAGDLALSATPRLFVVDQFATG
jgi:hypothetical protein